jgi:lipoyl(octanoyl) transferase
MIWRYLCDGFHSGAYNMQFDESLVHHIEEDASVPILRIYGWKPYAVSLGFNQLETDFDRGKLQSEGIDIVRRPTGGKAILHANELTYSVVTPLGTKGPREMYRFINEGLLRGLELLGIHAELTAKDDAFASFYKDPASVPCFASSAKSEIKYLGKKLVGSAQRRYGNFILQHGSLLLGPEHLMISKFLSSHILDYRESIEEQLLQSTVDAGSILGRSVGFDETAEFVKRGFEEALGIQFESISQPFYIPEQSLS